ncbi:MAG: AMP-binding protein, partial [Gammaproteobacteria bacterium]
MNELFVRLAEQIATRPDGIVLQGADTTMTVSELDCAVHAFAATLQTHGITRLGLLAENSPGWIVADLACQCADVCLVPLPHYFSDTQIRHGIDRAGVEALITNDPGRVARVARCRPATFDGGEMYGLSLQQLAKPRRPALPDGTRKVTFTSGTTGAPRGVCLDTTHQLRVAQAIVTALGMTAPRHLCLLPLSTLLENVGGVYAALLAG